MADKRFATHYPMTTNFMAQVDALFQLHGLAIVPSFEGKINFHDGMIVVPYDTDVKDFLLSRTGVDPEEIIKR